MEVAWAGWSPAVLHSRRGMGEILYASPEPSDFELNEQLFSWLSILLTGVK